jgi:hypothetical protein
MIKVKETQIAELTEKFTTLYKKLSEEKKELMENKDSLHKTKLINVNLKKMIVNIIKKKEER